MALANLPARMDQYPGANALPGAGRGCVNAWSGTGEKQQHLTKQRRLLPKVVAQKVRVHCSEFNSPTAAG